MREIEKLTSQEYSILSLYLGLNTKGLTLTKSEIAREYGLSVSRVKTILSKGFQKLATREFKELISDKQ
jgi:DNA-directed RNA polymerase sigma subunit (sigma70/sigma32)